MSGNLIGLGRTTNLRQMEYRITGEANTQLLKRMIGTIVIDADRIAEKYANRMAAYARDFAPSSSRSLAAGRDSHNPHDTTVADSIYARRIVAARYVVGVDDTAWWAIFSLEGARRHVIHASATGATTTAHRASRRLRLVNRRQDILESGVRGRHRGLLPSYNPSGERRKLSTREITARAKRQARYDAMEQEAAALESLYTQSIHRAASGSKMLIFPWSKGSARWKGKLTHGLFVGPMVKHPGTRRNNFILKARARIGSPFAADLKRLLEGRYR